MTLLGSCSPTTLLRFLLLLFHLTSSPSEAFIYIYYRNVTSLLFDDVPAAFGPRLSKAGIKGILVLSYPLNGCSQIRPPPTMPPEYDVNTTKFIVLIRNNDCSHDTKVLHAQMARYSGAIVHNTESNALLTMNTTNISIARQILIPSVFTGQRAAEILKAYENPQAGVYVLIKPTLNFPLVYYLIPFTVIICMIIIVMGLVTSISQCTRCVDIRKRILRERIARRQLRQLPIHSFKTGDSYEMCVICLDEYEEDDQLRILPCSHAYHSKCVDPWLTRVRKRCPVCNQRALPGIPGELDTDDEAEALRVEEARADPDPNSNIDRTPLPMPDYQPTLFQTQVVYKAIFTNMIPQCLETPLDCNSFDDNINHSVSQLISDSRSEGEIVDEDDNTEEDNTQLDGRNQLMT